MIRLPENTNPETEFNIWISFIKSKNEFSFFKFVYSKIYLHRFLHLISIQNVQITQQL